MKQEENGKPTVLVVDDDEDTLILMQFTLEAEGYVPLISPNAQNALGIIKRHHPAMALLDLNMMGVDGADICRQIKSNPATASIPVIIFSGSHNIEEISKQCGADAYLAKPFSLQKFKEVFRELVNTEAS